jgi:hypothetical protein
VARTKGKSYRGPAALARGILYLVSKKPKGLFLQAEENRKPDDTDYAGMKLEKDAHAHADAGSEQPQSVIAFHIEDHEEDAEQQRVYQRRRIHDRLRLERDFAGDGLGHHA